MGAIELSGQRLEVALADQGVGVAIGARMRRSTMVATPLGR